MEQYCQRSKSVTSTGSCACGKASSIQSKDWMGAVWRQHIGHNTGRVAQSWQCAEIWFQKQMKRKEKGKETQTSTTNSTRTFFVNCWNDWIGKEPDQLNPWRLQLRVHCHIVVAQWVIRLAAAKVKRKGEKRIVRGGEVEHNLGGSAHRQFVHCDIAVPW